MGRCKKHRLAKTRWGHLSLPRCPPVAFLLCVWCESRSLGEVTVLDGLTVGACPLRFHRLTPKQAVRMKRGSSNSYGLRANIYARPRGLFYCQ